MQAQEIASKLNGRRVVETIIETPASDHLSAMTLRLDDGARLVIRAKHDHSLSIESIDA